MVHLYLQRYARLKAILLFRLRQFHSLHNLIPWLQRLHHHQTCRGGIPLQISDYMGGRASFPHQVYLVSLAPHMLLAKTRVNGHHRRIGNQRTRATSSYVTRLHNMSYPRPHLTSTTLDRRHLRQSLEHQVMQTPLMKRAGSFRVQSSRSEASISPHRLRGVAVWPAMCTRSSTLQRQRRGKAKMSRPRRERGRG